MFDILTKINDKVDSFFKNLGSKNNTENVKTNSKLSVKKHVFECEGCVLLNNCSQVCDKVEHDTTKLRDIVMEYECCPDCGCDKLYAGPCGGMSQNVSCSQCGHEFNFALPVFVERI